MAAEDVSLQQVERELLEEKAHALGRIGRRLWELSRELADLWLRWEAGDRQVADRYGRVRREFLTYLWYWQVQREAVGFRTHPAPETWLFVPPPLPEGPPAVQTERSAVR